MITKVKNETPEAVTSDLSISVVSRCMCVWAHACMSYVLLYRLLLDSISLRNQLKVKIRLKITTRYVMIT
jgi:hypothetical protein